MPTLFRATYLRRASAPNAGYVPLLLHGSSLMTSLTRGDANQARRSAREFLSRSEGVQVDARLERVARDAMAGPAQRKAAELVKLADEAFGAPIARLDVKSLLEHIRTLSELVLANMLLGTPEPGQAARCRVIRSFRLIEQLRSTDPGSTIEVHRHFRTPLLLPPELEELRLSRKSPQPRLRPAADYRARVTLLRGAWQAMRKHPAHAIVNLDEVDADTRRALETLKGSRERSAADWARAVQAEMSRIGLANRATARRRV